MAKTRGFGVPIIAAACACLAAALALGACQAKGMDPESAEEGGGGSPSASAAEPSPPDGGGEASQRASSSGADPATQNGGSSGEERPGQSLGYVGPDGEGVLDRRDYESDEAYNQALIDAAGKEADVPDVQVWEDEQGGYVQGTLVVNFYRRYGEGRAREVAEEAGGTWVSSTFAWGGSGVDFATATVYFPDAPSREQLEVIAESLRAREEVRSAGVDGFEVADPEDDGSGSGDEDADDEDSLAGYSPNDISSSLQYWLGASGFKRAWEVVRCSGAVEVAVLDSGIDLDHPDLAGNIGTTMPYDAYNQTVLQGSEQDTSGHGTKVAGVVTALADNQVGVAGGSFNAKVIPVRVNSSGSAVSWGAVMRALEYVMALTNTPEAVNMSFGKLSFDYTGQDEDLQELIDSARETHHIVVVSSAGNKGQEGSPTQWPAAFEGVLAVGALDADGSLRSTSTVNGDVDMCAYGEDILTTANPDYGSGTLYGTGSGTSFAAPQVAAAAALLRAQDSSRDADDVEELLFDSAVHPSGFVDVSGGGPSNNDPDLRDDLGRYGYGVLDAAAAVGWTASGGSPNTGGSVAEMYAEGLR